MRFTPAARRRACLCLEEYGRRKTPLSRSASLTWTSASSSSIPSELNPSASLWSMAPLVISCDQHNRYAQKTAVETRKTDQRKQRKLTLRLSVWNLSSLRRSRSLSLRLCLCCRACSASVCLCRALCRCAIPRLAPPWLGTLVKPWHRGKLNSSTWSKRTLLCLPVNLDLLRMDRAAKQKNILKTQGKKIIIYCEII